MTTWKFDILMCSLSLSLSLSLYGFMNATGEFKFLMILNYLLNIIVC